MTITHSPALQLFSTSNDNQGSSIEIRELQIPMAILGDWQFQGTASSSGQKYSVVKEVMLNIRKSLLLKKDDLAELNVLFWVYILLYKLYLSFV